MNPKHFCHQSTIIRNGDFDALTQEQADRPWILYENQDHYDMFIVPSIETII